MSLEELLQTDATVQEFWVEVADPRALLATAVETGYLFSNSRRHVWRRPRREAFMDGVEARVDRLITHYKFSDERIPPVIRGGVTGDYLDDLARDLQTALGALQNDNDRYKELQSYIRNFYVNGSKVLPRLGGVAGFLFTTLSFYSVLGPAALVVGAVVGIAIYNAGNFLDNAADATLSRVPFLEKADQPEKRNLFSYFRQPAENFAERVKQETLQLAAEAA